MRLLAPAITAALLLLAAPAGAALPDGAKLKPSGLGPLELGMTERQAERVLGRNLRQYKLGSCGTATFHRRDYLLFSSGRLARVSVSTRRYATRKGIRVGSSQKRLRALYPSAKRSRHAYNPDGSYFKVTFGNRRLVFETDGSEVTAMHGGRIPEVDYVEGCA